MAPPPVVIGALLATALVFAPRNGHAQTAGRRSLDTPEARAAATVFRAFMKARSEYDVPKVIAMRQPTTYGSNSLASGGQEIQRTFKISSNGKR
jgi:hypothetical protein